MWILIKILLLCPVVIFRSQKWKYVSLKTNMMVQASVSTEESKHFKSKIRALEEENYRLKKDVNGVFTWAF